MISAKMTHKMSKEWEMGEQHDPLRKGGIPRKYVKKSQSKAEDHGYQDKIMIKEEVEKVQMGGEELVEWRNEWIIDQIKWNRSRVATKRIPSLLKKI